MWKTSIRSAALLVCLTLTACASGPGKPSGGNLVNVSPKAQAEFNQAVLALKSNRDSDALRLLLGLTRQYPKLAGPFTNLGLLYLKENKLPEAKQIESDLQDKLMDFVHFVFLSELRNVSVKVLL